jgi:hypothetical protein
MRKTVTNDRKPVFTGLKLAVRKLHKFTPDRGRRNPGSKQEKHESYNKK